jgi:site-specific recombinase XerD
LDYLRKAGVAAGAVTTAGPPQPAVVDEFADWLRQHRGTAAATVRAYKRWIYGLVERLGEDPTVYTPQALRAAVVAMAAGHSTSTADQVVKATRMFLRFLAVDGRCSLYLVDGILPIAPRNQARLPSYLTREEMDKLVSHCDPATPAGLRDRAILLLLVRLGLRADDVRGLRLQDIDWTDASFCVTGKGRRETRLPLSQEVGDAILAYLEHGRPRVGFEQVFLTVQPPWRPMAGTVGDIVRRTLRRSGIETRPRGSHLLRHSAATAMLHEGASLPAIGAVLRHRSIETTTQYTRVDARLLRQVAQPWPEVAPC